MDIQLQYEWYAGAHPERAKHSKDTHSRVTVVRILKVSVGKSIGPLLCLSCLPFPGIVGFHHSSEVTEWARPGTGAARMSSRAHEKAEGEPVSWIAGRLSWPFSRPPRSPPSRWQDFTAIQSCWSCSNGWRESDGAVKAQGGPAGWVAGDLIGVVLRENGAGREACRGPVQRVHPGAPHLLRLLELLPRSKAAHECQQLQHTVSHGQSPRHLELPPRSKAAHESQKLQHTHSLIYLKLLCLLELFP